MYGTHSSAPLLSAAAAHRVLCKPVCNVRAEPYVATGIGTWCELMGPVTLGTTRAIWDDPGGYTGVHSYPATIC